MTGIETHQLLLVVVAFINLATAVFAYLAHKSAEEAKLSSTRNALNIAVIEKATNSMKDALVAASYAAGGQDERQRAAKELKDANDK